MLIHLLNPCSTESGKILTDNTPPLRALKRANRTQDAATQQQAGQKPFSEKESFKVYFSLSLPLDGHFTNDPKKL